MPTNRPRHVVTGVDEVAEALDGAAHGWPEYREQGGKLLQQLIAEGHEAIHVERERALERRGAAIKADAGIRGAHARMDGRGTPAESPRVWRGLTAWRARAHGSRTRRASYARLVRVLIVGSGAREHALVLAAAHDPAVTALACAPGNAGIASVAEQLGVDVA